MKLWKKGEKLLAWDLLWMVSKIKISLNYFPWIAKNMWWKWETLKSTESTRQTLRGTNVQAFLIPYMQRLLNEENKKRKQDMTDLVKELSKLKKRKCEWTMSVSLTITLENKAYYYLLCNLCNFLFLSAGVMSWRKYFLFA